MKYVITESKMDTVIDNYISRQFEGLEHQMDGDRLGLVNSKGQPVIIIFVDSDNPFETEVYILEEVYRTIYRLFSMNGLEDIQKHLVRWFKKHMNINVDEVTTFDNGESEYAY